MRITFRLILLAIVILGVALFFVDRAAYRRHATATTTPAEERAAAAAKIHAIEDQARRNMRDHRDGRHCLDAAGNHPGISAWIKAHLENPASFTPVATEITPVSPSGQHLLKMTYRAKRPNGSDYQASETFLVENSDCSFER